MLPICGFTVKPVLYAIMLPSYPGSLVFQFKGTFFRAMVAPEGSTQTLTEGEQELALRLLSFNLLAKLISKLLIYLYNDGFYIIQAHKIWKNP
jgi:hypothetical protein